MNNEEFKKNIKTISNNDLLEQVEFMSDGYYFELVDVCIEELRCRLDATKWHYPDSGEYITKPNLCIRYIDRSGDEFIGYTEWYYPSEDEVGYGGCVIDIICNGVSVDPNDIKMWCELPYPPKEEA